MNQYGKQEKVWLVKSSGRILGPYSSEEMKFLLERRKVSIIDEVREPLTRWGFIRENPVFYHIVEALRNEEATSLDHTTEAEPLKQKSVKPIPFFDKLKVEQQAGHAQQDLDLKNGSALPRADVANEADASGPDLEVKAREASKAKNHRTGRSKSIRPGPSASLGSWRLRLIGLIFLVSFGFVGHLIWSGSIGKNIFQKNLGSEDLIRLARNSRNLGLYEKALVFYKKAEALGPLDLPSSVQMASLLLEENAPTSEARRLLEWALSKLNTTDPLREEAQLAMGLSYQKEGNYSKAEEIYQSILFANDIQSEARLNLGISKMLRSDFSAALKEFNTFLHRGASDGLAVIGKAMAQLGLNEGNVDAQKLKSSVEDLDQYVSSALEFRIEALLIKAVVQQKLQDKEGSQITIKALLEEDPSLTEDHIHNILLDRQILRWDRLTMYCDFLNVKWGDIPLAKALSAFCSAQKTDLVAALARLEDAKKQFPKNTHILSQNAYLLFRLQRFQESQQTGTLVEADSVLAQRVLAAGCEDLQNWDCADQKWRRILLGNGNDLGALRGVAQYQVFKKHPSQATDFIKKGLAISPGYRPLLELKDKLDAP